MSTYEITNILISLVSLVIVITNTYSIKVIHKTTNSMKDELVAEVRAASLAKGRLKGRLDAQEEAAH